MSVAEVIIRLVVVALLIVYLFGKHRQRVGNWSPEPEDPAIWTGRGIDASKLMPRIERVRHDYLAGPHSPMHDIWHRQGLLASARRAVARLSFFQKRKSEEDAHKHAT